MDAVTAHRIHFAFTATYHYLFPQLTMGLSLIIVILKSAALRTADAHYDRAARFWGRILAINFVMGVVTGIPLEFQFGTNWSRFSREAGGVIGQPLAMEGVFAFFLESTFLGLFLFGEQRLGPRGHWLSAALVFAGSWVSGYFIIATNAWMQHPVGYARGADGAFGLASLGELLLNPWAIRQYAHTMTAAVITGCFVVASIGAYYLIVGEHMAYGRTFVRVGVAVGVVATWVQVFPTGDAQGRMVALHQPVTLAAMEGLFRSEEGAPIALVGQPDVANRRLDNPLLVPRVLSFLTYRRWMARVQGLDSFPEETWPDNIPLLYYSYHVMVGLGTIFVAIMTIAAWQLWRGSLFRSPAMLWVLMLALPFPYIANIAGWSTAELGRQPWAIYGLLRTADGSSSLVSAGNALFTLLGFAGMYALLTVLGLFLVSREIAHGPEHETT
jgi:cytochrome d ubiquinol oxidase subunit I